MPGLGCNEEAVESVLRFGPSVMTVVTQILIPVSPLVLARPQTLRRERSRHAVVESHGGKFVCSPKDDGRLPVAPGRRPGMDWPVFRASRGRTHWNRTDST